MRRFCPVYILDKIVSCILITTLLPYDVTYFTCIITGDVLSVGFHVVNGFNDGGFREKSKYVYSLNNQKQPKRA